MIRLAARRPVLIGASTFLTLASACVEPARIVVGDACGEEGSLPFDGWSFEAFELAEGVEDSFFAGELGLRGEVLPLEEPSHVSRRGDGLNLLAEGYYGAAVDALQDAAFAPLDLVVWISLG